MGQPIRSRWWCRLTSWVSTLFEQEVGPPHRLPYISPSLVIMHNLSPGHSQGHALSHPSTRISIGRPGRLYFSHSIFRIEERPTMTLETHRSFPSELQSLVDAAAA